MDLYVEFGPAEAARLTGISRGYICRMAKAEGLQCLSAWRNETNTIASAAKAARKRAQLQELMLDTAIDLVQRTHRPHIEYMMQGTLGPVKVTYDLPPASSCKAYATSAAILLDKYRLEKGEVTGRDEHRHEFSTRTDDDLIAEAEALLREAALVDRGA
jgi:hypothetical protein